MKKSNPRGCDDAEWQVRCDLAAAFQLCHHFDFCDLVWTHLSARVPGEKEVFLLNPSGCLFDEVTASNLIKVDIDGHALDGQQVNPAAFMIHSAVYRADDRYNCTVHLHGQHGGAISALREGLQPVHNFYFAIGDVAYHDYEGFAFRDDERDRLIANLGDCKAMILRNHGTLTVGETVAAAFVRAYYIEKLSEIQIAAMSSGRELILIPDKICREDKEAIKRFGEPGANEWQGLLRLLLRQGIDSHLR
ncbi:MAG: class II aldolase/adducin family protein [Proteobacteria bacterium]|nr:class II aldolase/adducin family protein [Pseudomonadota bacterium]MBT6066827.1 class II aldolase/adducin family protein [Pseudomonadota bacterium]MBT7110765.1 class II aldolase/adducin family protein [Pseudomonadota bacterium]